MKRQEKEFMEFVMKKFQITNGVEEFIERFAGQLKAMYQVEKNFSKLLLSNEELDVDTEFFLQDALNQFKK